MYSFLVYCFLILQSNSFNKKSENSESTDLQNGENYDQLPVMLYLF